MSPSRLSIAALNVPYGSAPLRRPVTLTRPFGSVVPMMNIGVARTPASAASVMSPNLRSCLACEAGVEPGGVQFQRLGVLRQVGGQQRLLIRKQQVVHLSESVLRARALGRLACLERLRVNALERKMAEDIAHLPGRDVVAVELSVCVAEVASAERALEV